MLQSTNKKGFTMVELLVVLVIIGILAAVAAPLYLANTKRAKMSEAIAQMTLIRQALRDYKISNNLYYEITTNNVQDPQPPSSEINADGSLDTPANYGADVDAGVSQYFSNHAYTVPEAGASLTAPSGTSGIFSNPVPQDFIIKVDGSLSVLCGSGGGGGVQANCAVKANDIGALTGTGDDFIAYMDNSGRIAVSYNGGTTFSAY